jgi:hypothetical protein
MKVSEFFSSLFSRAVSSCLNLWLQPLRVFGVATGCEFPQGLKPNSPRSCGAAEQAAEKVGKADPSRAKLYPNKRKNGACRGPLFDRS